MSRQVTLSNDDGMQLRQILTLIGLDQKTVSEETGVSRPWLSGVLKAETVKSVDAEMMETVATFLTGRLSRLPKGTLDSDTGQMATGFLKRFLPQTDEEGSEKIYPPGGAV